MNNRGKKIFLALSIIVPFMIYCVYYYSMMIKNAPYKFSEFDSITLKYGLGNNLVNQYHSKTGEYQYLNDRDSLVKTRVRLTKDELLYLHRKAAQLGFWDFPADIRNSDSTTHADSTARYYLEFKYHRKTKHVLFDVDFNGSPKLKDAARTLIDEVSKTINDAEDRSNKLKG